MNHFATLPIKVQGKRCNLIESSNMELETHHKMIRDNVRSKAIYYFTFEFQNIGRNLNRNWKPRKIMHNGVVCEFG